MKKFAIVAAALAVVGMLASPAMAEFKPYMSMRLHTAVVDTDGDTDYAQFLAANSRFGAHFTADEIGGRLEIGLRGSNYLRLLYGTYKMDMGTLLVGQTYTGYTYFSDQAMDSDQGNIGYGALYDGRQPMIRLTMPMGLTVAAIAPSSNGADDTIMPKIRVGYDIKMDAVALEFNGAVNVAQNNTSYADDEKVVSGLVSLNGKVMAGPAAIKFNVYAGQNLTNFGVSGLPGGGAMADSSGDISNTTNYGGYVQAGFDTGMAKVTVGAGYTSADNDEYDEADTQATFFAQANVPIAKGFFVVPEFSYFDMMDDAAGNEEDDRWVLGAKWQMNL